MKIVFIFCLFFCSTLWGQDFIPPKSLINAHSPAADNVGVSELTFKKLTGIYQLIEQENFDSAFVENLGPSMHT